MAHEQVRITIDGMIYEAPGLAVAEFKEKMSTWTEIGPATPPDVTKLNETIKGQDEQIETMTVTLGKQTDKIAELASIIDKQEGKIAELIDPVPDPKSDTPAKKPTKPKK